MSDNNTSATTTTDHEEIKQWVEERGGAPAVVTSTENLRVDFPDADDAEENLEHIGWDSFFEIFEDSELTFLHKDKTDDGQISRFNNFISREE